MCAEDAVNECVGIQELFHVFGARDDDGARAEGGDGDFLTGADRVAAAVAFAGRGADTDAWRGGRRSGLVPEELRIHALVNRGLIGAPEAVFLHEDFIESVTSDGLADVVVGVHHADVKLGDAGFGGFVTGPDSTVAMERDELGQGGAGHLLTADTSHLEAAVLEDFNIRLLERGIRVVQAQTEDQGGLVEEALLGLRAGVEDVLHTDALALFAELNLEHAFANPPVGDEGTVVVEGLEIWDCTEMSSNCHRTDT